MRWLFVLAALTASLAASVVGADTVVALRTIRPGEVIDAADIGLVPETRAGGIVDPELAAGQEARIALYQGQTVTIDAIGPSALFARNQIVSLEYRRGGLSIRAEGRALERGGAGDRVRVMNLASRRIVEGFVAADGTVQLADIN